MSHDRNLEYLNKKRIIYRRSPINDKPTEVFEWGSYYEDGTHECYELFRSKAKITTYRSLKWHLYVLWYLNPQMTQDLDKPPTNKQRKIIFKDTCGLSLNEKLSIVGQLIGKTKKVSEFDIYDVMLYLHDNLEKITIQKLATRLHCTTRTIHRIMTNELKKEKELLNKNL